jgi:hypothetical protein
MLRVMLQALPASVCLPSLRPALSRLSLAVSGQTQVRLDCRELICVVESKIVVYSIAGIQNRLAVGRGCVWQP